MLSLVRSLELPLALAFDRGRVMALPTGVGKASGFREVLRIFRLSPHNALAIGDAENDHDLLGVSEYRVSELHARVLATMQAVLMTHTSDRH